MTFSEEVWLLLIGAGIGLVSSIIGAVVQHFLSLRAGKIKAERQRERRLKGLSLATSEAEARYTTVIADRDMHGTGRDLRGYTVVSEEAKEKAWQELQEEPDQE